MFAFDYTCVQDITANLQLITHLLKPLFLTDIVPPKGLGDGRFGERERRCAVPDCRQWQKGKI